MSETKEINFDDYGWGKAFFLLGGIATLSPWNALVSCFDYLALNFGKSISFWFPVPMFTMMLVVNIALFLFSGYIQVQRRIYFGLTITGLCLISVGLASTYIDPDIGIYCEYGIICVLGLASTTCNSSFNGFLYAFPSQYISWYYTGAGLAGVTMNAIRMMCLALFDTDEKGLFYGTLIYLSVAGLLLIVCLFAVVAFYQTKFCQHFLRMAKSIKRDEIPSGSVIDALRLMDQVDETKQEPPTIDLPAEENRLPESSQPEVKNSLLSKHEVEKSLSSSWSKGGEIFSKIYPYSILLFTNYIQTFMMFPGVSVITKLDFLEKNWSQIIMITSFNIFDTIGRFNGKNRSWYSRRVMTFLVLLRFLAYPVFLLRYYDIEIFPITEDIAGIVTQCFFGLLNGFCTASLFILAKEQIQPHQQEMTGFLMVFSLSTGIIIGTFLALLFQ